MSRLVRSVHALCRRRSKEAFLKRFVVAGTRVLDVGCGNGSGFFMEATIGPKKFSTIRYCGIDIAGVTDSNLFSDFRVVSPNKFAHSIMGFQELFDVIICNHNLEHCEDPDAVLIAIINRLRPGGNAFLAFPSDRSLIAPSRSTTLNFFDDNTHKKIPRIKALLNQVERLDCNVEFKGVPYRPMPSLILGTVFDWWFSRRGRCVPLYGSWALYGFEVVLWIKKK